MMLRFAQRWSRFFALLRSDGCVAHGSSRFDGWRTSRCSARSLRFALRSPRAATWHGCASRSSSRFD
jgi:hypothetical protein